MRECVTRWRGHGRRVTARRRGNCAGGRPACRAWTAPTPATADSITSATPTTRCFGFTGPKAEAEEIKQRLTAFLRDELRLELSAEKTLITHARTGAAKFLGYEITTQHSGTSGRKTNQRQHSAARADPGDQSQVLALPGPRQTRRADEPCRTSATTTSSRPTGRSTGASSSTTCSPATSTGWTGCGGSWQTSLLKTLAAKHDSTVTKMAARYKAAIETPHGPRTCFEAVRIRDGTGNPWSHGSAASPSNGAKPRSSPTAPPAGDPLPRKEIITRLLRNTCELCQHSGQCRCTTSPGSPTSHTPATTSRHGPGSWQKAAQVPRGLPALPRPDPRRTATSRKPPRHKSLESRMPGNWHVRFGGGPHGKGPANCGHLAVTAYPTACSNRSYFDCCAPTTVRYSSSTSERRARTRNSHSRNHVRPSYLRVHSHGATSCRNGRRVCSRRRIVVPSVGLGHRSDDRLIRNALDLGVLVTDPVSFLGGAGRCGISASRYAEAVGRSQRHGHRSRGRCVRRRTQCPSTSLAQIRHRRSLERRSPVVATWSGCGHCVGSRRSMSFAGLSNTLLVENLCCRTLSARWIRTASWVFGEGVAVDLLRAWEAGFTGVR